MTATPVRTVAPHRSGGLTLLGVVVPLLVAWAASGGFVDEAQTPGATSGTSSASIAAIWGVDIAALVIALLCLWSYVWRVRATSPRATKLASSTLLTVLVVALTLGPAAIAANVVGANGPHNDQVLQTLLAVAPACEGQAISGAAPNDGTAHPLVAIALPVSTSISDDQASVLAQAPALGPLPDAVGGVQLVACIGPSTEVTLEVCNYTEGGSWTRMGYTRDVSIYAVQSGQQLDQRTFAGSEPDACPDEKAVGQDVVTGDEVGLDDAHIWAYVATWAHGSGETTAPTDQPTDTPEDTSY